MFSVFNKGVKINFLLKNMLIINTNSLEFLSLRCRRIQILIFVFFQFSYSIFAQSPFLISAGSAANDECLGITSDISGEIWTSGYFANTAYFGGISVSSNGSADMYVAHQDANGQFDWVFSGGGPLFDRAYDVEIDQAGNSYITGVFSGTVVFGSQILATGDTTQDIFVLKLDPTGNIIWVKQFGGVGNDLSFCIDVNTFGGCVVGGQFKGTSSFGTNLFTSAWNYNTNQQSYDLFILRLDNFGNVSWAQQGTSSYDDRILQVQFGSSSDVYATGQFSDTLLLDVNHPYVGYNFSFIAKFSSSGQELWFQPLFALQVTPRSLDFSSSGILLAGEYQGTLTYNGFSLGGCNSAYQNKCFLLKISPAGQILSSKDFGSDHFISLSSAKFDAVNSIWVTGDFKKLLSEFSLLTGNGVFNSVGFRDIYYAKLSDSLSFLDYKQIGGPADDVVNDLALEKGSPFYPILCGERYVDSRVY